MEHETIQLIVHSMDATELFLKSIQKANKNSWEEMEQLINEGNQCLKKAQGAEVTFLEGKKYKEFEQSLKLAMAFRILKNAEELRDYCLKLKKNFKKMKKLESEYDTKIPI